jgi:hypothetical protein
MLREGLAMVEGTPVAGEERVSPSEEVGAPVVGKTAEERDPAVELPAAEVVEGMARKAQNLNS